MCLYYHDHHHHNYHHRHFWLLFYRPIFIECTPGYTSSPTVLQKKNLRIVHTRFLYRPGCTSCHPTNQQCQNTEDDNYDNGFQISKSAHPPLLLRLMPLAVRHSTHAQSVTTPLIGGDTLRIRWSVKCSDNGRSLAAPPHCRKLCTSCLLTTRYVNHVEIFTLVRLRALNIWWRMCLCFCYTVF